MKTTQGLKEIQENLKRFKINLKCFKIKTSINYPLGLFQFNEGVLLMDLTIHHKSRYK